MADRCVTGEREQPTSQVIIHLHQVHRDSGRNFAIFSLPGVLNVELGSLSLSNKKKRVVLNNVGFRSLAP